MTLLEILLALAALVSMAAALLLSIRVSAEIPAGPIRLRWKLRVGLLGLALVLTVVSFTGLAQPDESERLLRGAVLFLQAGLVLLLVRDYMALVKQMRRVSSQDRTGLTDALTGMRSRSYLDKRMEEEMSRSQRHGLAVSLILLDVDDFASINRAHGHGVGDQVLMEIGEILAKGLRTSDVLVRYAGEEMAILATDTAPQAAFAVAERLRRDIEVGARKALREAQGARRSITVSAGLAGIDAGVRSAVDLFDLAEKALDRAKKEGKNRVAMSVAPAAAA